jgi:hypothetical protein
MQICSLNVALSDTPTTYTDNLALCRRPKHPPSANHQNVTAGAAALVECDPGRKEDFYVFEPTTPTTTGSSSATATAFSTGGYLRGAGKNNGSSQNIEAGGGKNATLYSYKSVRTGR